MQKLDARLVHDIANHAVDDASETVKRHVLNAPQTEQAAVFLTALCIQYVKLETEFSALRDIDAEVFDAAMVQIEHQRMLAREQLKTIGKELECRLGS